MQSPAPARQNRCVRTITMKRNTILIAATVLLAVVFLGGAQWYRAGQAAAVAAQNQQALQRPSAVTVGRADAPVEIVEFFDPACGTCAQFEPLVKNLMAAHPDQVRLRVRYAPFHPGSDEVVKAIEASRRQGKFWEAVDALFAAQAVWVENHHARAELIWPVLARAGLDIERLRADMQSPEVARVVAQDMADANAVGVAATPEFYVNGRPLPSFGYDQLRTLVDEELAASNKRS
jgi:protein-disulfide isomerase